MRRSRKEVDWRQGNLQIYSTNLEGGKVVTILVEQESNESCVMISTDMSDRAYRFRFCTGNYGVYSAQGSCQQGAIYSENYSGE